ncbi:hypothetical protein [Faecalibacillus faecis]|uniref:hypothetical protein n=1 Tax=Faecalibacillus faecis TaxID=1982628 RepID=UPI00386937F6
MNSENTISTDNISTNTINIELKENQYLLAQLPELNSVFHKLVELRTKEIEELKKAQENCTKIIDYSRNLDFEKLAKDVLAGINFSIKAANENLCQCKDTQVIVNREELSKSFLLLFRNSCLGHTINISGRLRNFSNELSLYISQNNQTQNALSIANECATIASSIAISFNNAKDLCTQFDENLKFIIESLTTKQISHQIDEFNDSVNSTIEKSLNEHNILDEEIDSKDLSEICNNNCSIITKFNLHRLLSKKIRKTILLIGILFPALLVLVYSLFFCNSMYISESKFVINSNSAEKALSISPQTLLNGGGNNDIYVAIAYIKSMNLFNTIDQKLDLKTHFKSGDIVSSLSTNATNKEIEEYWKNIINVDIDSESELLKLAVRSYSPQFSLNIQKNILSELDSLINRMNEKAHKDAINLAEKEVQSSENEVEKTALELKNFRDNNTFISPEAEVTNFTNIIGNLEKQLSETKTELEQKLTYFKEDSLEIKTLKSKIDALNKQLNEVRTRIASNSTNKTILSNSLNEYENLSLKHEFAKKKLESAMTSLEAARQISLTKTRYLVMVESPTLPDESLWPTPFKSAFITLLLTIFSVGIISLIISAIREHMGV